MPKGPRAAARPKRDRALIEEWLTGDGGGQEVRSVEGL